MPDTTITSPSVPLSSDAPATGVVAISYAGGDQTLTKPARGFHIDSGTALKVQMLDGSIHTFTVVAGIGYPYAIKTIYQNGSNAAGAVLL